MLLTSRLEGAELLDAVATMADRFVSEVERLSGRPVETFISNSVIGPDLEIELFFLGDPA